MRCGHWSGHPARAVAFLVLISDFSLFSRCTVCFRKTGDSRSVSGDDAPAVGVTRIEFISLLTSQDSLVCFSIGKGPILILS